MCANYYYSLGSVCIESSLIVSWARKRLTSLIAVNCHALAPTKTHWVTSLFDLDFRWDFRSV